MARTPLMIVSDGPNEPTGLGRIARDLCASIVADDLPFELVQVGGPPAVWGGWTTVALDEAQRGDDWGASLVDQLWQEHWGDRPGILWVIWDPGRLAAYTQRRSRTQLWSYPAIDAPNRLGSLGGPAAEAIARADRVIAYGRWAGEIIRTIRPAPVPYLPHGLNLQAFAPVSETERAWADMILGPYVGQATILGCVATNQPRKDLGLYVETLAELRARGLNVYGWLHTDVLVKAWSLVQLVEDCGLSKRITVTTKAFSDRQLAALYQRCAVTIAPGLGEGFGYPIVESLAAGVPVVHGDFGGGRELVPRIEWRFLVREVRLDGIYAQRRPIFRAEDAANAIERVLDWRAEAGAATVDAYCRGAVAHLDWQTLWPRWRAWILKGLE